MNRILFPQARDVLGVTSMVAGAALQRAPADTVRHLLDEPHLLDELHLLDEPHLLNEPFCV